MLQFFDVEKCNGLSSSVERDEEANETKKTGLNFRGIEDEKFVNGD
jgi:hypothetical protein